MQNKNEFGDCSVINEVRDNEVLWGNEKRRTIISSALKNLYPNILLSGDFAVFLLHLSH